MTILMNSLRITGGFTYLRGESTGCDPKFSNNLSQLADTPATVSAPSLWTILWNPQGNCLLLNGVFSGHFVTASGEVIKTGQASIYHLCDSARQPLHPSQHGAATRNESAVTESSKVKFEHFL